MALGKLTPNVMVEDVNATIEFYTTVLGFALVVSVPETGKFNWALLKSGEAEIMLQTRASLGEELPLFAELPIGGALTFYIHTDNVQALREKVQGKAKIVQDLHTTFYGATEFALQDCNGYILAFAQT